jgi:hypothetical protein
VNTAPLSLKGRSLDTDQSDGMKERAKTRIVSTPCIMVASNASVLHFAFRFPCLVELDARRTVNCYLLRVWEKWYPLACGPKSTSCLASCHQLQLRPKQKAAVPRQVRPHVSSHPHSKCKLQLQLQLQLLLPPYPDC